MKKAICNLLEILRWAGIFVGIFLAKAANVDPVATFSILCFWVVVPLTGFTGLESLFFGKTAASQSGYSDSGPYQRQSGLNNLSVAITTILAYLLNWGAYAKIAVMTAALIFFTLSAINHTYNLVIEGNKSFKNFLRPAGTILLLIYIVPYMIDALKIISK
jgi:hypothetical protein